MKKIIEKLNILHESLTSIQESLNTITIRPLKYKVFLGGTTSDTTWRDEIIPKLEIDYFNPIVDDWIEECIAIENDEKENKCGVHLYVITPKMEGVYSIAEAVESSFNKNKVTVFCILEKDKRDKFNEGELKSLDAVEQILVRNGAVICNNINHVIEYLNSITKLKGAVKTILEE